MADTISFIDGVIHLFHEDVVKINEISISLLCVLYSDNSQLLGSWNSNIPSEEFNTDQTNYFKLIYNYYKTWTHLFDTGVA